MAFVILCNGCAGEVPLQVMTHSSPDAVPAGAVDVMDSGAIGDGQADDGPAIQAVLDGVAPGSTVVFPAGHVFRHSGTLRVSVPRTRLTGGGTLLAGDEERSSVLLAADSIEMDGLKLRLATSTKRWAAYEQMKLRIAGAQGVRIQHVAIEGSAAAGIYVGQATDFEISDVRITDTRADGLHMTESARGGRVSNVLIERSGDDGIAVVSYRANKGGPCRDIVIADSRVTDQRWGRAFSVVGGTGIRFSGISSDRSSGAALYLASEHNFDTLPTTDVAVDSATFTDSNMEPSVDHGAVLMFNGQPGTENSDLTLKKVVIRSTRADAARDVGIMNADGATQGRITLEDFTIDGGPATSLATNGPATAYRSTGWIVNGAPQPPHEGW